MKTVSTILFFIMALLIVVSFVNIVVKQKFNKSILPVQFNHFVNSGYVRWPFIALVIIAIIYQGYTS